MWKCIARRSEFLVVRQVGPHTEDIRREGDHLDFDSFDHVSQLECYILRGLDDRSKGFELRLPSKKLIEE